MAGGLFNRLKTWIANETLTYTDLNGEFNNIINNCQADKFSGYSDNLGQMQTTQNPGDLGSEVLTQPISIANELQRLRYVTSRIVGKNQWYQSPSTNLETLNSALSQAFSFSPSRIISGNKSANSNQPKFLQAKGSGGVRLLASSGTPFNVYIDSVLYTFTANIDATGLASAPASNTATLNETFADAQYSKGVNRFIMSAAGAGVTVYSGRLGMFKINNGSADEYFVGTVQSSTEISKIFRGYLFDTSNIPIDAVTLTSGHTITALKMTFVFIKTDGTLSVTYNNPAYGPTAPVSAVAGDYWYDTANNTWKYHNGTTFVAGNAAFVGICGQDGSGNTVAARSADFYNVFKSDNSIRFRGITNSTVYANGSGMSGISVYGENLTLFNQQLTFDMTTDLASPETEQASTLYYLYITQQGARKISSIKPIVRPELFGIYHPYETWRCVGQVYNNASSNFELESLDNMGTYYGQYEQYSPTWDIQPSEVIPSHYEFNASNISNVPVGMILADGTNYPVSKFPRLYSVIGSAHGTTSAGVNFNVPDLRGRFARVVDAGAGRDPDAATRTAMNAGGNTADNVGSVQDEQLKSHTHTTAISIQAVIQTGANNHVTGGGSITTSATGGNETRPKNANVKAFIKT